MINILRLEWKSVNRDQVGSIYKYERVWDTSTDKMASVEAIYTVIYVMISICLIAPPTEFVSAGLTVQNLFGGFLGSEEMNFVYYHIKRTTATMIFHSFFPIGYYIGMVFCTKSHIDPWDWVPWRVSLYWQLYLLLAVTLPIATSLLALYWYRKKWRDHPVSRILQCHAPTGSSWTSVASSINIEFRRIDKFTTGIVGRRLIVTDSWVMKTTTYFVHVAHQQDIHLTMIGTDEHEISHDNSAGVQYLNILVTSIREQVKPFQIRLNAVEFGDLKEKLHSPVRNARSVIIRQSLSDRFLEAFRQQVQQNDLYVRPPEMEVEQCIGCMQTPANVKLQKLCDELQQGECVQCYCRPMWCLECMSKWFASRQNQSTPETWMSSKSPCPTCRSRFCMLDVCRIV